MHVSHGDCRILVGSAFPADCVLRLKIKLERARGILQSLIYERLSSVFTSPEMRLVRRPSLSSVDIM